MQMLQQKQQKSEKKGYCLPKKKKMAHNSPSVEIKPNGQAQLVAKFH